MDVTVADTGPCQKTLSVKISADQVRLHIDRAYKEISQQVEMKGFRKGKVPRHVLEKKFGEHVLHDAKESLINDTFNDAVREQDLPVVGTPKLEGVEEGPLKAGEGLEYDVIVDVRPAFELADVKGLEIKRGEEEVTDEDVSQALQQFAEQKRKLQTVDDAVQDGDFVKTKLTFKNEAGETVTEREAQLNTRIPIAGTDADTFAPALQGSAAGQTVALELTFPDTFEKEDVRGQKGSVDVAIQEVLRVVAPPVDEELAKSLDFESLEAMKEDLRRRIGEEKKRINKLRQEEDAINALISENPFALPQSLVEEQTRHLLEQFRNRLKEQQVPDEQIEQKIEESKTEARQDAERRVRVFFLLDAIARKEKIFVTEGDVEVEIRRIAAENQVTPEQVREFHEKHKLMGDLRVGLMERKVRDFLREHAQFTD